MGKSSSIQWTDNTWNPWMGCWKVSLGCLSCYMYRDQERYGNDPKVVTRTRPATFNAPLSWKSPVKVFTCSWSDFFIKEADQWRDDAWKIIKQTPHITYQILTKRAHRIEECLPSDWGNGYPNVWLGVSVEDNESIFRIDILKKVKAAVKFVSFEPLLELIPWQNKFNFLDWIIVGGESGNDKGKYQYRPLETSWIRNLILGARDNNVACFVKQFGTYASKQLGLKDRHGGDVNEWPKEFQVQEFPN